MAHLIAAPPGGEPDQSGEFYRDKARILNEWFAAGALTVDPAPGFYPYSQSYTLGGKRLTRRGFIGLGDLRDARILPHEETHPHVRDDRARLRRATAADFGLIFVVYSDPTGSIDRLLRDCEEGNALLTSTQPDGSTHKLRRCADPNQLDRIVRQLDDLDCVIADGHHRTAAAFDTWQATGDDRWAMVMMAFFNADAPGMTVLPIHRGVACHAGWDFAEVVERLAGFFSVIRFSMPNCTPEDAARQIEARIAEHTGKGEIAFGMVGPETDAAYVLEAPSSPPDTWPWPHAMPTEARTLPTALFEVAVLRGTMRFQDSQVERGDRLTFPKNAAELIGAVRAGERQLGFILPPTPLAAVFSMARRRRNMPQKSTYFFPKLLTGLTVHRIETGPED